MKFVAVVRPPTRPDEAVRALADVAGITVAEARMRLAPEPPALIARLKSSQAEALVAALRKAALAVIALTVLKAFLVDMAELVGLWRVLSFLGLGLALIALGWVYRRFVVLPAPGGGGATPPPAPAPQG
jgi:hypothetical protein